MGMTLASHRSVAILTAAAPARYPPATIGAPSGNPPGGPGLFPLGPGWRPRASTPLFLAGSLCIAVPLGRNWQHLCANRAAASSRGLIARPPGPGASLTLRLSTLTTAPGLGSLRSTGQPDLSCASDQPGRQPDSNVGYLSRHRPAWLPGLLNCTTTHRTEQPTADHAGWLSTATNPAE